jgi:hypothetical protein
VVALTRLLGIAVRWLGRTRRRQLALLVVPLLVVVALLAPRTLNGDDAPAGSLAGDASTGTAEGGAPAAEQSPPTGTAAPHRLPGTTGPAPAPTVPPRREPRPSAEQARIATAYVQTVNTHDARPGRDADFLASYRRARPYVTASLYRLITLPSRRGDYQWAQWQAQQATVGVRVQQVAVPDGAPAPTATTAYLRVQFRQVVTPHAGGAAPSTVDSALTVVATRSRSGWLVSRLLADT